MSVRVPARRHITLSLAGSLLFLLASGEAAAQLPQTPSVQIPTVQLPTVQVPPAPPPAAAPKPPPVPPVTVPPAPPVKVPPAPPVKVPPAPPTATPSVPSGGGSGGRGSGGGSSGAAGAAGSAAGAAGGAAAGAANAVSGALGQEPSSGSGGGDSSGQAAQEFSRSGSASGVAARPRVRRFTASRNRFKTGAGNEAGTVLVFSLSRAGVVRFTVREIAPTCRTVGSFTVRARRGRNRVPFTGQVRGEHLTPGTYTVTARAVRAGRREALRRITIVVVDEDASLAEAKPQRSVCAAGDATTGLSASSSGQAGSDASGTGSTGGAEGAASSAQAGGSSAGDSGGQAQGGAEGTRPAEKRSITSLLPDPYDAPRWLEFVLYCALALAVLLLLAALAPLTRLRPRGFPARPRRTDLALAGLGILACLAVAALLV
jgi:hypothetical protein